MRLGDFIGLSRVNRAYDGFKQVIAINYLNELIAERKLLNFAQTFWRSSDSGFTFE